MKSINVAELKTGLRRYLDEVRAGEEIIIRDRDLPVAKIVPIQHDFIDDPELLALAAEGKVRLPQEQLTDAFWEMPTPKVSLKEAVAAVRADRDEE